MAIEQLLQSKQSGLPPQMMALLELEQAKQALMQSGVAPGTVAGQKLQEAQMLTQPPAPPNIMPGIQQAAAQAQQQPATQGDIAQVMRQVQQMQQMQQTQSPQPVMAARGGIITLPADVNMAEGGIVGYNGDTDSAVKLLNPEFDEEGLPRGKDEREQIIDYNERLKSAYRRRAEAQAAQAQAAAATAPRPAYPEEAKRRLEQFYRFGPRGSSGITADAARFEKPTTPTPQQLEAQVRQAPGTSYQPDASLFRGAAPRPPAAPLAASAAPASGVASLMGPPVPTGSERQFGEAIAAAGRVAEPEEITPEKLQAQREAIYRARGIDPDFAKARLAGIERLKAMDEEAKAQYAQSKKDIAWENLATRLAAMGGAPTIGEAARRSQLLMAQRYGEQRKADQQFNQLMRVNEEARIKEINAIDDMNRALAEGDIGRAEKRKAEILELRNTKNLTEAKMRAQYAPQLLEAETAEKRIAAQEREGRLDRESRERIAKWNDATQMAVAKARVEGKNPYDTVLDNVRAEFADWLKSGVGLAADAAARNAMYQEIYARHLKIAKEFGVKVPEGAGRGATGTKENPIKLD